MPTTNHPRAHGAARPALESAVEEIRALERRLRASFRRLRSHVESSDSPAAAVQRYLADADVGLVAMR